MLVKKIFNLHYPTTNKSFTLLTAVWLKIMVPKAQMSQHYKSLIYNSPFCSCVLSYICTWSMNASEAGGDQIDTNLSVFLIQMPTTCT